MGVNCWLMSCGTNDLNYSNVDLSSLVSMSVGGGRTSLKPDFKSPAETHLSTVQQSSLVT